MEGCSRLGCVDVTYDGQPLTPMRLSEERLAPFRGKAPPGPGYVGLRRLGPRLGELVTPSWTFFPLELGDEGAGVVALLGFTESVPVLDAGLDWVAVEHQSGGYACSHPVFVGVRLSLKPVVAEWLGDLARDYFGHCNGYFSFGSARASDIEAYNSRLKTIGLHCEHSYSWLHEAVYPIDATVETLSIVSPTPPDLNRFGDPWARLAPNFGVFVLAANSD